MTEGLNVSDKLKVGVIRPIPTFPEGPTGIPFVKEPTPKPHYGETPKSWEDVRDLLGGPAWWEREHDDPRSRIEESIINQIRTFLGYKAKTSQQSDLKPDELGLEDTIDTLVTRANDTPFGEGSRLEDWIDTSITQKTVNKYDVNLKETLGVTTFSENEPRRKPPSTRQLTSYHSPYAILFGTQTYRRFTGYYDPCKALKERSHDKVFTRKTRKAKQARQKAIRVTYYNRSKCK